MEWSEIKRLICEGREFSEGPKGYSVIADTIMPSGHIVKIFMRADHGLLTLHDDGIAFDELAVNGLNVRSMTGVRRLMQEVDLRVDDRGVIFLDQLEPAKVACGISVLADASLRAAQYLLANAIPERAQRLDTRLKDILRVRHQGGKPDARFRGKRRQHRFDFGFTDEGKSVLVDAVSPDTASVNAAIVKSLDVREMGARPILVYDRADGWKSDLLDLLDLSGSECVSIEAVGEGRLLAA